MAEPTLHVYPQEFAHDEVYLFGNRAGLEALLHALASALLGHGLGPAEVFDGDGEGYAVHVHLVEDELQGYVAPYATPHERSATWPLRKGARHG